MMMLTCVGSRFVFRSFLDPDPYSEYGSGSTHANIGKIEAEDVGFKIFINNTETTDLKCLHSLYDQCGGSVSF